MDVSKYTAWAVSNIGVEFNDVDLLVRAFTHRSYLNEHKKTVKAHNERLEFLGDAVLELVVTEFLYRNYEQPEGVLTNWRSALVRTESIGAAATRLGFSDLLRLSRGEKHGSERARAQIVANAFEAVIGAIYLDQGYGVAKSFIEKNILSTLDEILRTGSWMDPKSRLQEVAQSEEGDTPHYRVLDENGPDHDKEFTVGVFVGEELKGKGVGPSKQAAQQQAATVALEQYQKTTD